MSVKIMGQVWDLDIPPNKKFVLLAYADHADHAGNNVFPSVSMIAQKTGYGERQIKRIKQDLIKDGYLVEVVRPSGKAVKYRIECHPCQNVTSDKSTLELVTSATGTSDIGKHKTVLEPSLEPSIEPSIANAKYTDLIKAWLDVQGSKNSGAYKNKNIQSSAKALFDDGFTAEDVTAFTTWKKQDAFWKDKFIGFDHVANEINAWKAKRQPKKALFADDKEDVLRRRAAAEHAGWGMTEAEYLLQLKEWYR